MKKSTARQVLKLGRQASASLIRALKLVQKSESKEDFRKFRTGIGKAMGEIYFVIVEPVMVHYPELLPPGLRPTSVRKATRPKKQRVRSPVPPRRRPRTGLGPP